MLSPYLRHRLILESEVAKAVLGQMSYASAEKFLQEICWRTYWKGWLELRPQVWSNYRLEVSRLTRRLEQDPDLKDRLEKALSGRTEIRCFDFWADELCQTGYLHNHARMWFASIWIFTLKLPWELGADFFYRHLLDGDPASNTLSWRWVAGLQTLGKTYLARPDNIAQFTAGRFPDTQGLATEPVPIEGFFPPAAAVLNSNREVPLEPFGLLLTEEDLEPTSLGIPLARVMAVAGILEPADRSPLPVSANVRTFSEGAMEDALERASREFQKPVEGLKGDDWNQSVVAWTRCHGFSHIVCPEPPQGPARERVDALCESLKRESVVLSFVRRNWDEKFWPLATAGFFPFKVKVPAILESL